MRTKYEIVLNWLPRDTGMPLEEFGEYVLVVNFQNYVRMVCAVARGRDSR